MKTNPESKIKVIIDFSETEEPLDEETIQKLSELKKMGVIKEIKNATKHEEAN